MENIKDFLSMSEEEKIRRIKLLIRQKSSVF